MNLYYYSVEWQYCNRCTHHPSVHHERVFYENAVALGKTLELTTPRTFKIRFYSIPEGVAQC